jgi:hypothetical protein
MAQDILESSQLKIIPAQDLDKAASKAVKMANIVKMARDIEVDVQFELSL